MVNYNAGKTHDELMEKLQGIEDRIVQAMRDAGKEFVTTARDQYGGDDAHAQGFYQDRTGNLRHSIGYMIFKNGELVDESAIGTPSGEEAGRLTETEIKAKRDEAVASLINPKGYQLIGIAGMGYASYVEAKGYNVITIYEDVCFLRLAEYFEEIKKFVIRG